MKDNRDMNGRLMRYSLLLQEYDFDLVYIKGCKNNDDYLSRCYKIGIQKDINLSTQDKDQILNKYHEHTGHGNFKKCLH
ncbi:hypothetical protein COBT_003708 [Conglomerata obtusa]